MPHVLTLWICAGERIFDWFTPAAMYKHKLPFTVCFTAAMFIIFFYCAAEFPVFFTQFASFNSDWSDDAAKAQACYANSTSLYYGPGQLQHWIRSGVGPFHDRDYNRNYVSHRSTNLIKISKPTFWREQ